MTTREGRGNQLGGAPQPDRQCGRIVPVDHPRAGGTKLFLDRGELPGGQRVPRRVVIEGIQVYDISADRNSDPAAGRRSRCRRSR